MGSSAPQEGPPFPVWRRHAHAGSNCSMREVLLWLHSACGRPIIRAPHSAHVHGRLPPHRHMVSGVRRCPWFKDDPDAYVLAKTRDARKSRQ